MLESLHLAGTLHLLIIDHQLFASVKDIDLGKVIA